MKAKKIKEVKKLLGIETNLNNDQKRKVGTIRIFVDGIFKEAKPANGSESFNIYRKIIK